MSNRNPGREITCPRCPKLLRYVTTRTSETEDIRGRNPVAVAPDTHVYECASHGRFHVGPNGRMAPGS